MKEVAISQETPRDESVFNEIRITKGLEKKYMLAVFLMFGGIVMLALNFLPPFDLSILLFKSAIGFSLIVIGALITFATNYKVKGRKKALSKGKLTEGMVIAHNRKFNPTSSKKHYVVVVKYFDETGENIEEIKSSSKEIFDLLPMDTKTPGILTDLPNYRVFFPAEVGVKLQIK